MRDGAGKQTEFGQFSRRTFAVAGGAGAAVLMARGASAAPAQVSADKVSIATPVGKVDGVMLRAGADAQPGIVMWGGSASEPVARDLAARGFAVLLVDGERHAAADEQAINREAKALVRWLGGQEGIAPSPAVSRTPGIGNGYVLRGVSAARPTLSLASRSERQRAATFGLLFALPEATVARVPARMDLIRASTRLAQGAMVGAAV